MYVIGFDLGTTAFKAALFDRHGRCISRATEPCSVDYPQSGWAEQDAHEWWRQAGSLTQTILSQSNIAPDEIAALAFASQMCGLISVDTNGDVTHPAMIWLDTRSHQEARQLVAGVINVLGYGLTAAAQWLSLCHGAPSLSGREFISKIHWLRRYRPDVWERSNRHMDVKDFMVFRATGEATTSPDCAHLTWLMNARKRKWSPALMRRAKIEQNRLPAIQACDAPIGDGLTPNAARHLGLNPGTKVVCGAGDILAAALGAGATGLGQVHISIGTSNWMAAHIPKPKVSPFTLIGSIAAAQKDRYLLIAAQENFGNALIKVANLMGVEGDADIAVQKLIALAAVAPAGANGLLFLPWLSGERVPVDETFLRGGFANLSLEHTREDMARAVLEGLAYNLSWAAGHFFTLSNPPSDFTIPVVGGLANSDLIMQILADVLERRLGRATDPQWAGARGAFISAAVSLGWRSSFDDPACNIENDNVFSPNRDVHDLHQKRFEAFKAYYSNNRRWHRRLNNPTNDDRPDR